MSKRFRAGTIGDPVHDYVNFTGIERAILDHRVAQRLRYVAQSGLAHLVYPEVRTSRFSHSLGAMHLASSFFKNALENSDEETQHDLLELLRKVIDRYAGEVRGPDIEAAARSLRFEPLQARHCCPPKYLNYIDIIEQALRLAALFHDLGHLPFSHDYEHALDTFWRNLSKAEQSTHPLNQAMQEDETGEPLHERLGHSLSVVLLNSLLDRIEDEDQKEAADISFKLAQRILDSNEKRSESREDRAIYTLHSLIDGELDVDRCDYILRDGRNYGFDFGTYDLKRVLDNLVFGPQTTDFRIGLLPHGISALESFLIARARSHQYSVRHHKISQIGAALRYTIGNIIGVSQRDDVGRFQQCLSDLSRRPKKDGEQLLLEFSQYDDIWWTAVMRDFASQHENDEWAGLVCWRKPGPRSLWKWMGDFPPIPVSLSAWNAGLPAPDDPIATKDWADAVKALRQDGVLVHRHEFKPWRTGDGSNESKICVYQRGKSSLHREMIPASQFSSLIRSLKEAWDDDVQVQAFATSKCTLTPEQVIARLPVKY